MHLFGSRYLRSPAFVLLVLCLAAITHGQSSDQNFPTPVISNEIAGTIKARDIGDARLTTYFYAFNGIQGDIFINVVTRNFSGDIDVYLVDGLRPLTKMVIYAAETGTNETGRLVYLRKAEKLLLRIEGRTPNDDPAAFRIKFGGSFVALSPKSKDGAQTVPKITSGDETGVQVNSVGTIIEPEPKPPVVADKAPPATEDKVPPVTEDKPPPVTPENTAEPTTEKPAETDAVRDRASRSGKKRSGRRPVKPAASNRPPNPPVNIPVTTAAPEKKPDPLEKIRLVIVFKDEKVVEFPMSDVISFSVDKGILTVITKDGNTAYYSIFGVAKVTIE